MNSTIIAESDEGRTIRRDVAVRMFVILINRGNAVSIRRGGRPAPVDRAWEIDRAEGRVS